MPEEYHELGGQPFQIPRPASAPPVSEAEIEALARDQDRSDLHDKDLDVLAVEARYHREQAELHHRQTLYHFVEMGRRLLEAKSRPGMHLVEFNIWAQSEAGVQQAQAYRYMRLARPENLSRVINMPPDTSVRAALDDIAEQRREERTTSPVRITHEINLPPEIRLELGDAADLSLPDEIIDLIVTSPPYGLGIEYADGDDDQGYVIYMEHALTWSQEMYRVAKPQGRLCLNVPLDITRGGRQPMYADWLAVMRAAGWQYDTTIIWNKDNINNPRARGSVDSPSATHVISRVETISVMYKGEWNLHRGRSPELSGEQGHADWLEWTSGLWTFPGESRAEVLAICPKPFPEELPRRLMKLYSYRGDTILDPFLGSGTVAVVATQLGRPVYGFDHSPVYMDGAQERVDRELARLRAAVAV